MAALAEAVSTTGYTAMTVEDVISRAGVSRRTFYDHFKSKEDAFLHAFDGVSGQLFTAVLAAYLEAEDMVSRLSDCLSAFLQFVANEPAFADMCIVEVLAAGDQAIERRDKIMRDFAGLFDQAGRELVPDALPPPLTSEALVGGVYEVVYKRVLRGETASLPESLPDLVYLCLLPYVGRTAALEEYEALRAPQA